MNYQRIRAMQKQYGFADLQEKIDSGQAWTLEGSYGRAAMDALEIGACMLPTEQNRDYYGNTVPSRYEVADGSKGSYKNSVRFWKQVYDGEIDLECEVE